MKVATNAPTMPSTVVRMKPAGLLGPGDSSRAMMPATKPMTTIHRMPMVSSLDPDASDSAVQLLGCRQPSVGRKMIDRFGQLFAEAGEQFLVREASAGRQEVDLFGRQDLAEIGRRDGLV